MGRISSELYPDESAGDSVSGVKIGYGDVAVGAKEEFIPSSTEDKFDKISQLSKSFDFPNYANPCELYQTVLDGTASAFPSTPTRANLGLWSEQISNDDGTFDTPIVLTLTSQGQYSSQGLTLTFDKHNNIFANDINIKWYRVTSEGEELLADEDFYPNSAEYFCYNRVDNYNKIVISFNAINMPKNRLKFTAIDYGYGTVFAGDELKNVSVIQDVDPISSEITIDTVDFTIDSKRNISYSFQDRQPLTVYFNDKLIATTFVSSAKRTSKKQWQVKSNDYIGILDKVTFVGGMYTDKPAVELLTEIFNTAKVPYELDKGITDTISGYIPYTTCRDALMQVCFALQVAVDTSGLGAVKVFYLDDEVKQEIPLNRIRQGQSFTDEDTVTRVELTSHSYTPIQESVEVYSADNSGAGEGIEVVFSEPLHSLSVTNGTIISSGTNFAIINANAGCVLSGKKYKHSAVIKIKRNEVVLANDVDKVVSVTDATLISASNVDKVLEKCYNWIVKNTTTNMSIIEGKHVSGGDYIRYGEAKYGTFKYGGKSPKVVTYDKPINLGDVLTFNTEYLGKITGRIYSQKFNLNGGIIMKEVAVK